MKPFQYATATAPAGARELVGEDGAYLAGGNDLLALMKEYILNPGILVNVKALPGSQRIEAGSKAWTIGAAVTVAEIEDHAGLKKTFPALQQAASEVGSRQIRNVATVGGNLAQHSRCWYYRQRDVLCLKKGGDTCYARHGENKYHSLFTGNTCISPVVSNLSVALTALGASALVQRGDRQVRLTLPELYAKAWDNPTAHNSLEPGDLILGVEIPVQGRGSAYRQISEKSEFDWALVSCAAAGKVEGGKLTGARVVLGAVSPVPYESKAANDFLEGKALDEATAAKAADMVLEKAHPHPHNAYKVPIARTLILRTLTQLETPL
jgi:xanthine dehydrogenase YagS FAD-binding subunit